MGKKALGNVRLQYIPVHTRTFPESDQWVCQLAAGNEQLESLGNDN